MVVMIEEAQPAEHTGLTFSRTFWRLIPRLDGTTTRMVTALDDDGTILYQSPPVERFLGYSPSEMVGVPLVEFLKEPSRTAARDAFRRMTDEGWLFDSWRFCFEMASGERMWLEGQASNFLKDPRLGGIIVYWQEMK